MNDNTLLWIIVLPLVGLMVLMLGIGGFLVIRDTVRRRGKWGVNARPVYCPECGEPAPTMRKPANRRQALWGGHTCKECGTEYDKWGNLVEEERPRRRRGRDESE